jgi:hypothetical protein
MKGKRALKQDEGTIGDSYIYVQTKTRFNQFLEECPFHVAKCELNTIGQVGKNGSWTTFAVSLSIFVLMFRI